MQVKQIEAFKVMDVNGDVSWFRTERVARRWASFNGGISVDRGFIHVAA